jgi:serine/threonine protein phosphatase PrpC
MDETLDDVSRRKLWSSELFPDDFAPASALVQAEVAARSHPGRRSQQNDDHYLVLRLGRSEETLFTSLIGADVPPRFDEWAYGAMVADGIGAGGAGAMAARVAVSTLARLLVRVGQWNLRVDPAIAEQVMDRSRWFYARAHEAVLRWYRAHLEVGRMATALTALWSAGPHLFVAHVGHSRCYVLRGGRLTQLTRDQTLRERLTFLPQPVPVERGLEDVEHVLTAAIGVGGDVPSVSVEHFRLEHNDSLLLCTNGLTDMVADDAIADILASRRTPQEQCDLLIDAALTGGGTDNITVVLAHYDIPRLDDDGA